MKYNSQTLSAASGSQGGQTFSRNRGGSYTRKRSVPTNPRSARQTAVRSANSIASSMWSNSLTAAQRSDWTQFANANPILNKLGNSIVLSGHQMWMRWAVPQLTYNSSTPPTGDAIPVGPFLAAMDASSTLVVTGGNATLGATLAAGWAIGDYIWFNINAPVSAGSTAAHAPTRVCGFFVVSSITGPDANLQTIVTQDPFYAGGANRPVGTPVISQAWWARPSVPNMSSTLTIQGVAT